MECCNDFDVSVDDSIVATVEEDAQGKHSHSVVVPQTEDIKKKLLVLDMDETLLHHTTPDVVETLPSAPDANLFLPEYEISVPVFLNLDEQLDCGDDIEMDCSNDVEVDCCDDFEVSVDDSIVAAVEDDAKEKLGSLFYIDEKGRQRRRSHRLLSKR
jgi:hypothetical protein